MATGRKSRSLDEQRADSKRRNRVFSPDEIQKNALLRANLRYEPGEKGEFIIVEDILGRLRVHPLQETLFYREEGAARDRATYLAKGTGTFNHVCVYRLVASVRGRAGEYKREQKETRDGEASEE